MRTELFHFVVVDGQDGPPLACQGIILEIDNDGMRHAAVPKEWLQSAGLFTMCV